MKKINEYLAVEFTLVALKDITKGQELKVPLEIQRFAEYLDTCAEVIE